MADPVFVDDVTPLNAVNMNKLQTRDEKAALNGYPSLDAGGRLPDAQVPARLGVVAKLTTDWNTAQEDGWYGSAAGAANAPESASYIGHVSVSHLGVTHLRQTLYDLSSDKVWMRRKDSTWQPWVQTWPVAAGIPSTLLDAKGDLIAASANDTAARLAVGSNNQVLTADSAQATGMKWAAPAGGTGYSTTLPGSPTDGQEHILVDSTSAPTYHWRFRYNASGGTYKWEFIGGYPKQFSASGPENIATSTYGDVDTVFAFTAPYAGIYDALVTTSYNGVGGGVMVSHGVFFGGTLVSEAVLLYAGGMAGIPVARHIGGLLAAGEVRAMYATNGASTPLYYRTLTITPKRVSA